MIKLPSRTPGAVRRRHRASLVAIILLAGLTATQALADNAKVTISNFTFDPPVLTVKAGTTVTWVNQDDVPHNIVSSEGKTLKSPVMDTDGKFSYTFTTAGAYPYYCGIHPKMIGKVIVQ